MIDKYNLLLMLNDSYLNFGKIFLNSVYINCNLSKLNKIIINNIGLSEENKILLKKNFDKIEYFDTEKNIKCNKVHSKEWVEALTLKSKTLHELLKNQENTPIILIDSDMMILKDFTELLDPSFDIQVCKPENPGCRKDIGITLHHVACFAVFYSYNETIKDFMNDWQEKILELRKKKYVPAYETPAMCLIMDKYKNKIKFGDFDQKKIASEDKQLDSYILHFRSTGPHKTFEKRIRRIPNSNYDDVIKLLKLKN